MKLLAVTLALLLTLGGLSILAAAETIGSSSASYVVSQFAEYGEAGPEAAPGEEGISGESGQPEPGVTAPETEKEQSPGESGSEERLRLPESPSQQEEGD